MSQENDDAFLNELIGRLQTGATQKVLRLSKGTIPISGQEESRLIQIAQSRGKENATSMLEEMLR